MTSRGKIKRMQIHEVYCPHCESASWIEDPYQFFTNEPQKCSQCDQIIQTGPEGLEDQIILYLRIRAAVRAIKLAQVVKGISIHKAKVYVKNIAKENKLVFDDDASPAVNLFMRLIISAAFGFAVVGIGGIYFPSVQKIAEPVLCRGGEMGILAEKFNTLKTGGETEYGVVMNVYCTDENGNIEEITKKTFYVSAAMYAAMMFIFLNILGYFRSS